MIALTFQQAMARLPAHVSSRIIEVPSGCWLWTGADSGEGRGGGYGRVSFRGRTTATHILVWRLTGGRLLRPREQLDHTCVQRRCCNPAHLQPRYQPANVRLANRRRALKHHEASL